MSGKRYTIYYNERERDMYVVESQDGKYVLHSDYAALLASHNALVEAVKWMLYIDTPENFEGGKHIKARAEVDKLLQKEPI